MPATLTIRDESLAGDPLREWALEILTETLTVRELIRSRVYQEVQDHNLQRAGQPFHGLVRPAAAEAALNGDRKPGKPIDWKAQYELALAAFEKNQVIILVNDRQAEALDEEVTVGPGTAVTFLRLTLLVGG